MSKVLLVAVTFLVPLAGLRAEDGPPKPNILFLFADDQRADTIAALGNPVIKTPYLDRLVRQGVAFDRAYMQGGLQGATCVPSRAMLLSGRPLFRIDEKLQRDPTWPNAFGKAGYTTFMTGKWHNGSSSISASFQKARSIFAGGMTNPMQAQLSDLVDGKLSPPQLARTHACEVFADEAIRFLREHKGGPFFCYVAFDAPHDPHIVPETFPIKYEAMNMPLPPNFLPQHPWNNGEMLVRDELLLPWPRTPEKVRAMNAEYYRYISYLDSQIGRILDALEASPYARNTIVVFSADSGVARGSHGLIGKQNVYEHSVRVPLIISGPGIPAGQRASAMCYLFDVLPTLGKLCSVPAPKTSEGFDFSASLIEPTKPARSQLMFAYRSVQRAICDGRWKLIRYPQVNKTQLFDLVNDPHETVNLVDKHEQLQRIRELTALLEKEQAQNGDTCPLVILNPKPAQWMPPARNKLSQPQSQTPWNLPLIDLDGDKTRQVIVDREKGQYLGHPTTVLLEDGKTILCVYPKGHGKGPIQYKRSVDGGKTWSERLPTPKSWESSLETPTLHRVVDAAGKRRIILFSGLYPIRMAVSEDDGMSWSELRKVGDWGGVVTMASVMALKTGPGHYLALFHDDGRFISSDGKATGVFTLYQTRSINGGLTWSTPLAIYKSDQVHLCEPGAFRSPDGRQIAVLLRENRRLKNSHVMFSDDEGMTWTQPREVPGSLTGDRHVAKYGPDGRLLISFRDVPPKSSSSKTAGDWVGWVGTYEDIVKGKDGQYLVRLKKNYHSWDCAYPGVEILPDGTFVATTYGHWTPNEPPYILSVRFTLKELDEVAKKSTGTVQEKP